MATHIPFTITHVTPFHATSLFYSFRLQNDNNKQNFNQSEEALQIRTLAIPAEAR